MAHILVVDDDAPLRRALRRMLEAGGHEVLEAGDGFEAVRVWREKGADLVFLDIHMPVADGIEALIQFHALDPKLPVIMMSGGDQTGYLDLLGDASLLGARTTLRKPFTRREVLEAVARALNRPETDLRSGDA
ncbi:MAG TPA: response regulator [Gemmatimonadales bacterium]|jgi:CheY-like chemotaxis protein